MPVPRGRSGLRDKAPRTKSRKRKGPSMQSTPRRAFTLVELLVVIAIIVILLALLVGGLDRALKAAERSKCGANQRAIAQSCTAYALEYERTFPVASRFLDNT